MQLDKIISAYKILRGYGPGFCAYRLKYALLKRTPVFKRKFPLRKWSQIQLGKLIKTQFSAKELIDAQKANRRKFFFETGCPPQLNEQFAKAAVSSAELILQNRFRYFFDRSYDLGNGPDWFVNPVTGQHASANRHWCDIDYFDPEIGDIKFIWEPSRFAWAYILVRAFAATRDEKYAEKFWTLFASWLESNQPNTGPNYACGQECAIRLMAMCFGFYALANSDTSSIQRKITLITAIAVHADRIEKNIDFAISTKTNHSLTEAAGLYTAGMLFPEFKSAGRWLKLGKRVLTNEGLKQIYPDGSYIQHSMNYHRLMLQDFVWVLRLAQLNDDAFDSRLLSRVSKASRFIYQMQDHTGRVPNYGANDGALIVPLNGCEYFDYRPVVQAVHYFFNKSTLYDKGPWDEDLLWLFGPDNQRASLESVQRFSSEFQQGGYYTLRNQDSWAMVRCHTFNSRPGHADMLHTDLWWSGINILRDSGTYMYNCPEPWSSYFGSTAAHNTIVIDGMDQTRVFSRFARLDWTRSKLLVYRESGKSQAGVIQGEHYGYRNRNNAVHRRTILSLNSCWLIIDDVLGSGSHDIRLCWQLCDYHYEIKNNNLVLKTEAGPVGLAILNSADKSAFECFRGDMCPAGWQSLYYGSRTPSPVLICRKKAALPVRFVTVVSLGDTILNAGLIAKDTVEWTLARSNKTNKAILP